MAEEKKERKENEAKEKIKEINRKLAEIDEKVKKIEVSEQGTGLKLNLKSRFDKITEILNKMLSEDVNDYEEKEIKQIGNFKVEKGLRIRFLDDGLPGDGLPNNGTNDTKNKAEEVKRKKEKERERKILK